MRLIDPVAILNAESPLRVWSVIVTVLGDVIMRQGRVHTPEPIWIGTLLAILNLLGIDAAHVRTNLSRLVANGTLERSRSGRNTYYRLSQRSTASFADAAAWIYGRSKKEPTDRLHVILIDRCVSRAEVRQSLEASGTRFLSATTGLVPEHRGALPPKLPNDAILASAICTPALAAAVSECWRLDEVNLGFCRFCEAFRTVDAARLIPEEAMATRIVLVHNYRRLVLRDPGLPKAVLPADWAGDQARTLFDRLHAALLPASNSWMEAFTR